MSASGKLWYCAVCTRLINPPGSEGIIAAGGIHYCEVCAPSCVVKPPTKFPAEGGTAVRTVRSTGILMQKPAMQEQTSAQSRFSRNLRIFGASIFVSSVAVLLWTLRPFHDTNLKTAEINKASSASQRNVTDTLPAAPASHGSALIGSPDELKSPENADGPAITSRNSDAPAPAANHASTTAQNPAEQKDAAAQDLAGFIAGVTEAKALLKGERYGRALDTLERLNQQYGTAKWWDEKNADWKIARKQAEEEFERFTEHAADSTDLARTATDAKLLEKIASEWQMKAALDDDDLAKHARSVLNAVAKSRQRLAQAALDKKTADVTQKLTQAEAELKRKPRLADPIIASLQEIQTVIAVEPALAAQFVERTASLLFDARTIKNGKYAMFGPEVAKPTGSVIDMHYDFKTQEQFAVWTFENPTNNRADQKAEVDTTAGAVVLNCKGDHGWEGRDRRGMPLLRIPFIMRRDKWQIEAEVVLRSSKKKERSNYGILIWDGTSNVIRLALSETRVENLLQLSVSGSTPADEKLPSRSANISAKAKDAIRLIMLCDQGEVSFYATLPQREPIRLSQRVALNFEPKFVALFLRTHERDEQACAVFENVHIMGMPDSKLTQDLLDKDRAEFVRAAKPMAKVQSNAVGVSELPGAPAPAVAAPAGTAPVVAPVDAAPAGALVIFGENADAKVVVEQGRHFISKPNGKAPQIDSPKVMVFNGNGVLGTHSDIPFVVEYSATSQWTVQVAMEYENIGWRSGLIKFPEGKSMKMAINPDSKPFPKNVEGRDRKILKLRIDPRDNQEGTFTIYKIHR